MSVDPRQGSEKTGVLSSDSQPSQTMPSLTTFRRLQIAPYGVNTERISGAIRWICILLSNATRNAVFFLFDDKRLLQRLRVKVHIDYPAVAMTSLGDVHTGSLITSGTEEKPSQQVLVKALRMSTVNGINSPQYHEVKTNIIRDLMRECYMWSSLSHENVCRFKGLAEHDAHMLPLLVTAFIPHQCMDYIHDHPDSKSTVLRGVASGIKYLHDNGIAHGDVRPDNIMISNEGQAQLVNFRAKELESIIDLNIDQRAQRNTRFCAPELLKLALTQSDVKSTLQADVFSFAMSMLQILDGRAPILSLPYNHYHSEFQLWLALTEDDGSGTIERPLLDSYENMTTAVQGLLQRCWEDDPERRPSMGTVISELPRVLITF